MHVELGPLDDLTRARAGLTLRGDCRSSACDGLCEIRRRIHWNGQGVRDERDWLNAQRDLGFARVRVRSRRQLCPSWPHARPGDDDTRCERSQYGIVLARSASSVGWRRLARNRAVTADRRIRVTGAAGRDIARTTRAVVERSRAGT